MVTDVQPRFVAYHHVSVDKQGRSGLGLDAQREAVAQNASRCGSAVVAAFEEVESGRKGNRPQLTLAMAECRLRRSVLLIAKLDCLARDAHFLLGLKKAGVEFLAAAMSYASRLNIGVMALVAEEEARATPPEPGLHSLQPRREGLGSESRTFVPATATPRQVHARFGWDKPPNARRKPCPMLRRHAGQARPRSSNS